MTIKNTGNCIVFYTTYQNYQELHSPTSPTKGALHAGWSIGFNPNGVIEYAAPMVCDADKLIVKLYKIKSWIKGSDSKWRYIIDEAVTMYRDGSFLKINQNHIYVDVDVLTSLPIYDDDYAKEILSKSRDRSFRQSLRQLPKLEKQARKALYKINPDLDNNLINNIVDLYTRGNDLDYLIKHYKLV